MLPVLLLMPLQSLYNISGKCAHVCVTFDERMGTLQLVHIGARQPLPSRMHVPVAAMSLPQ